MPEIPRLVFTRVELLFRLLKCHRQVCNTARYVTRLSAYVLSVVGVMPVSAVHGNHGFAFIDADVCVVWASHARCPRQVYNTARYVTELHALILTRALRETDVSASGESSVRLVVFQLIPECATLQIFCPANASALFPTVPRPAGMLPHSCGEKADHPLVWEHCLPKVFVFCGIVAQTEGLPVQSAPGSV